MLKINLLHNFLHHYLDQEKIHKSYIAIVKGEVNDNLKKMVDHLEYFEKNKKIKLKAITLVKIIKKNTHYSLLELNPITGRKHQLRNNYTIEVTLL